MKDLLRALRESDEFKIIMDELIKQRPVVPSWAPGADPDDWKYKSGQQAGFDLLYQALVGKRP